MNLGRQHTKQKMRSQLILILKSVGVADPKGNQETLRKCCIDCGLPVEYTDNEIREGWMSKPKGVVQILFERGWINPRIVHLYTGNSRKGVSDCECDTYKIAEGVHLPVASDPTGCNYSVDEIMKLQMDFRNKLTLLQFHATKLGVILD